MFNNTDYHILFIDNQQENRVIINHLLHIFKVNVHKSNVHKDLTVHY